MAITTTRIALKNAVSLAITGTSAKFSSGLKPNQTYRIVSDVDFWYTFDGENSTVTAAATKTIFQPAGVIEYFTVPTDVRGGYLHCIRSAVSGTVNLAEVVEVDEVPDEVAM